MIDWYAVGFAALWIFGLGLEVAVWSFACYLITQRDLKLLQVLEKPSFQTMIGLGLAFFCLGITGTATSMVERGAWAILTFIFIWWILDRKKARKKRSNASHK